MIKFAVLNDLHFADNPPIGRQPGYTDQLFDKLQGVFEECRRLEIPNLLLTGDIFHVKRPDRVSHSLVNRIISALRDDFGGQVMIVPGNHDLTEAGIDTIERQPIWTFFNGDTAMPLMKNQWWCVLKGSKGERVMFVGRHYDTAGDLDPDYYPLTPDEERIAKDADMIVMAAHGSIVPPGRAPVYPHITADEIVWGKTIPDLLICGHLHEDYGIHKVKGGPIYANLGSFGRPSRNQSVDSRDFLVVSYEDKIVTERIPIPNMLSASEVFREKAEEFEADSKWAELADQLASDLVLEEEGLDEALERLGKIPVRVKQRIKQYLEEAGA